MELQHTLVQQSLTLTWQMVASLAPVMPGAALLWLSPLAAARTAVLHSETEGRLLWVVTFSCVLGRCGIRQPGAEVPWNGVLAEFVLDEQGEC